MFQYLIVSVPELIAFLADLWAQIIISQISSYIIKNVCIFLVEPIERCLGFSTKLYGALRKRLVPRRSGFFTDFFISFKWRLLLRTVMGSLFHS